MTFEVSIISSNTNQVVVSTATPQTIVVSDPVVRGPAGAQGVQGALGLQGAQGATGSTGPKSITILNPTNTDNVTIFYTPIALTITNVASVLYNGTNTPSLTYSIQSGTSRATVVTTHVNGDVVTTTTGADFPTIASTSIAANSFVWVAVTAVSGTVPEFHVSLSF